MGHWTEDDKYQDTVFGRQKLSLQHHADEQKVSDKEGTDPFLFIYRPAFGQVRPVQNPPPCCCRQRMGHAG
jgi:hypothetical protein